VKNLRFARAWWLVVLVAAGVLIAAGTSAGKVIVESGVQDWTVSQTPNPGYYGNILHGISARSANRRVGSRRAGDRDE
jgi:hypothetical protein